MQTWADRKPWSVEPSIDDDRLGWELKLTVREQPPLDAWGLTFGEAAHHLRALLDNAVVTIGKHAGLTSSELKKLQFPIAGSKKEWASAKSRVRTLPEAYRQAIENVQPFQRELGGEMPEQDLLLLLRDLDNEDKHHLQVQPQISRTEINHKFGMQFETEQDAARSVPPDVTIYVDAFFVDGATLMRQVTKGRIRTVTGELDVWAQVNVVPPDRPAASITEVLGMLCFYTGTVLEYLAAVDAATEANP